MGQLVRVSNVCYGLLVLVGVLHVCHIGLTSLDCVFECVCVCVCECGYVFLIGGVCAWKGVVFLSCVHEV